MFGENLKMQRKAKGLSQEELVPSLLEKRLGEAVAQMEKIKLL